MDTNVDDHRPKLRHMATTPLVGTTFLTKYRIVADKSVTRILRNI